jgi:hypothetical protein
MSEAVVAAGEIAFDFCAPRSCEATSFAGSGLRCRDRAGSASERSIRVIFEPCRPNPPVSLFWSNASERTTVEIRTSSISRSNGRGRR